MMQLAADAARARLEAASALREACEGHQCPATELRMAFLFDVFRAVPADMVAKTRKLDGG